MHWPSRGRWNEQGMLSSRARRSDGKPDGRRLGPNLSLYMRLFSTKGCTGIHRLALAVPNTGPGKSNSSFLMNQASARFPGILAVLAIWSVLPATMLVLQLMGFDFGFNIWPFGEFRNWLEFLQEGAGFNATKLFWMVDNRNALSPWWYIATRPLISLIPSSPLILHLSIGLFVGLSAYLLMLELTCSPPFAVSIGSLSALFIVNVYRDEINWNFVGALGFTLLSIWLFALFCRDRCNVRYLAASYLAWFVAFSTYTIQVGALGAIFIISLRDRLVSFTWPRALAGAILDALPYAGFLFLYGLLWITTSAIGVPGGYTFSFSFHELLASIAFGLWNDHYLVFLTWLNGIDPPIIRYAFPLLLFLIYFLFCALGPRGLSRPTARSLGFAFLVGVCVVAPTILLEASSDVWVPGTRWPMVMQFWPPLLFCLLSFSAMSRLPNRIWTHCWRISSAMAAAFVILLALGFNRTQILHVRQERAFFEQLMSVVVHDRISGRSFPRRYLIQLAEPAPFLPVVILADRYAHTLLGRDVSFRLVADFPELSKEDTFLIWRDKHLLRPPEHNQ